VTDPTASPGAKPIASPALPSGVTLREAVAGDIPEMSEVVNASFEVEAFFVNAPRTHAQQLAEHFRSGHFLLAHQGARLIASVYYEVRGERGYLGMLAVRPDQQRTGLGRAMIQSVEEILRASGCKIAELSVVSVRTNLLQLYGKLGYCEDGTVEVPDDLQQKLTMPVQLIRLKKPLQDVLTLSKGPDDQGNG
jgi:GNAT superfamily N-acetyltransferase